MHEIVRTSAAVRDMAAISDWLADRNLDAALQFYDDVDRRLKLVAHYPLMGEAVDHLAVGLRRTVVGEYLLFYRVCGDAVELIRVLHGARDVERLF